MQGRARVTRCGVTVGSEVVAGRGWAKVLKCIYKVVDKHDELGKKKKKITTDGGGGGQLSTLFKAIGVAQYVGNHSWRR